MKTFSARLVACKEKGALNDSDLARWFQRPRATVNTWVNGRVPFLSTASAEKWLVLLEWSIAQRKIYWPVPDSYSWAEREKHVRGMRDDAERNCRVPDMRATA